MNKSICILGMHRSGTSAVTRGINLYGAVLGEPLMPAHGGNPKGHWEHEEVVAINETLLNMYLFRYSDTLFTMPDGWWLQETATSLTPRMQRLIQKECSNGMWAWKDPRTCLTIPLWQSAFQELGIDLNYLIVIRNPLDVAMSLKSRDGMALHKGLALWALYTLSALKYTSSSKRYVIHYDTYIEDWKGSLNRIGTALDIPQTATDDLIQAEMQSFLSPSLRHHHSSVEDLLLATNSLFIPRVYELCEQACANPQVLCDVEFQSGIDQMFDDFLFISKNSSTDYAYWQSRVFWNTSEGYSELCSTGLTGECDGNLHTYSFDLPSIGTGPLIFIPVTFLTCVEIGEVRLETHDGVCQIKWSAENGFKGLSLIAGMVQLEGASDNLLACVTTNQPQITLNIPQEVFNIEESRWRLEVLMKVHHENSPVVVAYQRLTLTHVYERLLSNSHG